MWAGLALADWIGTVPPGSAVILVAIALYAAIALSDWARGRVRLFVRERSGSVDTIET
jgi:hypothetical protein